LNRLPPLAYNLIRGKNMLAMQIKEEALKLNPVEKAHLAELLLVSLDRPDSEIEQRWVEESEQRYAAYKRGEIQGVPLDQFAPRLSK
jgi:putative addiction module component (TIGR02574 family)